MTCHFCACSSGIEYGGCVMDMKQMDIIPSSEPDQSDHSESEPGSDRGKKHVTVYLTFWPF